MKKFNLNKFGITEETKCHFDIKMVVDDASLGLLTIKDVQGNKILIDYTFDIETCTFGNPSGFYFSDISNNYIEFVEISNGMLSIEDSAGVILGDDNDESEIALMFNNKNVMDVMREYIS